MEPKRFRTQLRQLNRTLTAHSHSNQALLYAEDEPALLDRICRIVTEDCGHAMVWIGFAENDHHKTVRPVACAGSEDGYLDVAGITWADNERGSGPTGMAIRTGEPQSCRNMLTDPKFEAWRKEALKRGYASSLVLPLILPPKDAAVVSAGGPDLSVGKVFGALTIYSNEAASFSADEVKLLSALAADLAHGIGVLRVRTAHAQAEAALQQERQHLRTVVNCLPAAVLLAEGTDLTIRLVNPAYQALAPGKTMVGRTLEEVWPEIGPDVPNLFRHVLATGEPHHAVDQFFRIRRSPNGPLEPAYFSWSVFRVRLPGKEHWALLNTAWETTRRKKVEDALRRSEERWAITLQSIGDAVISTDAAGKVVFMNEVAQKLTGWPFEEAKNKDLTTVFNIVQEVTRIKPESPVSKVVRLGTVVGLANHTVLIRRDGTEVPIEDSGAPIRNREGRVEGVVLVFHDVSEQRTMEKALRDSERLATTGRLAATIAHEIHNPLDTVGNLLYLIQQSTNEQTTREYVSAASHELACVAQMTQQMLTFQRESTEPKPVQIKDVLDDVLALYARKIEAAAIRIDSEIQSCSPIVARPGEMRQIFANLIGNAVEAVGTAQGKIRLRVHASRDWHRGSSGLRVLVADNGRGIPAELREKIFDPFFTTKGESGTGLGLWITMGIVEKYGGTIRLRSSTRERHLGTCFSVFFPAEIREK